MARLSSSYLLTLPRSVTCLLILGGWLTVAMATPVLLEQEKFSIDIPEGWTAVDNTTPEIVLARESADKQKTVRIGVIRVQTDELVAGTRDMVVGMKGGMTRSGLRIESERDAAMEGLFFHTLVARGLGAKSAAGYTTSAGNRVYGIQLHSNQTDASADPELQGIVASFRLITSKEPDQSAGFRIGYQLGQNLLLIALVGALLLLAVGAWLLIRKKRPRKRRRSHRRATT